MTENTQVARQPQTQPQQQQGAVQNGAQRAAQDDGRYLVPRVDVHEDDTGISLLADLPGVAKDALDIQIDGDTLTLEARVAQDTPEGLQAVYAEVRVPRYRRAFTLSRELDSARIEANLKDGVLTLRIPKQAHAQPRRIEVQVH
jgi:HSP20 family molecular chaperone IbpA